MLLLVHLSVLYLLFSSVFSLVSSRPSLKYCDQIGNCKPGQHVMCMYYKSDSPMSSKCIGNPIDITIENRLQILTKINKMRSDTRHGIATGKNNISLPKGYELKDLEWDDDLASFAQVWANQCSFNNGDKCRATERFPNPGQFMGGIQYAFPNIEDLSATEVLRRSKATIHRKASGLIDSIMNFVYDTKNYVTSNMVFNHESSGRSNLFLLAVYGKTTHIGCAMSYWVSLDDEQTNGGYDYYTIALVCNLSAQPVAGQKVYETNPAIFQTPSSFNPGYNENDQNAAPPAVVLMPLIGTERESLVDVSHKLNQTPAIEQQRQLMNHPTLEVRDRYFNRISMDTKINHQNDETTKSSQGSIPSNMKPANKKYSSIFNRVPKFELPSKHRDDNKEITLNNLQSKNEFHSTVKLSNKDLFRLKKLMLEFSTNKKSQPVKVMQPTSTDIINTLFPEYTTDSIISNNFNERSDKELINFMYNLVQKTGIGFDELINVTADILQDDNPSPQGKAVSKYNERYKEHNDNNAKHEAVSSVDDRLGEKDPQLLGLRKLNPLMQYEKNRITYNKNDRNNLNRNNDYYFITKNVRGIRETEPKHIYRNDFGSYTRSIESDKINDYYSAGENVPGRKNLIRKTFNNDERKVINRLNYYSLNYYCPYF